MAAARGTPAAPPTTSRWSRCRRNVRCDAVARRAGARAQRDFGENRAQELVAKAEALARRRSPHRSGTSSVGCSATRCGVVAPYVALLALGRPRRARPPRSRATRPARGCSCRSTWLARTQKGGCAPGGDAGARRRAAAAPGLDGRGPHDRAARGRRSPAALRGAAGARRRASACASCSMGMSGDFEAAIGEGATMVRVGQRDLRSSPASGAGPRR